MYSEREDGISLERAVAILDRLRRAYREWDATRRELLDGLLPLVRDAVPDLWGALWIGLATAIDRLTRNEESDLLKYVVEEMERSEREFWCEESGHVYPPASTNSTRKRRGKAPHPALRRQAGNIDDSEGLSQGKRKIDRKGRPQTHWFTIPIKLPTTPDHEEEVAAVPDRQERRRTPRAGIAHRGIHSTEDRQAGRDETLSGPQNPRDAARADAAAGGRRQMTFSKHYALILAGRYDVDGNEESQQVGAVADKLTNPWRATDEVRDPLC